MNIPRDPSFEALGLGPPDVAFQEALKGAQEGAAYAQSNLAVCYASGKGVGQDFGEALKWWRRAAEQGDVEADYQIGNLYAHGRGVPQDQYEAAKYFRKAAERGHPSAQYNLGRLFRLGEGVPLDLDQAYIWLNRAVGGYQERIDSGFDFQKFKKDAISMRRKAKLLRIIHRCYLSLGMGTLYGAAHSGDVALARHLLEKGADPNIRGKEHGTTPLINAAIFGKHAVAELLIANGANVNAANNHGATPLYAAAENGHRSLIELLLAHGADVNISPKGGVTPPDGCSIKGAHLGR